MWWYSRWNTLGPIPDIQDPLLQFGKHLLNSYCGPGWLGNVQQWYWPSQVNWPFHTDDFVFMTELESLSMANWKLKGKWIQSWLLQRLLYMWVGTLNISGNRDSVALSLTSPSKQFAPHNDETTTLREAKHAISKIQTIKPMAYWPSFVPILGLFS